MLILSSHVSLDFSICFFSSSCLVIGEECKIRQQGNGRINAGNAEATTLQERQKTELFGKMASQKEIQEGLVGTGMTE
jgi:hypothetical protein